MKEKTPEELQTIRNDLFTRLIESCTPMEAGEMVASLSAGVVFCSGGDRMERLEAIFKAAREHLFDLENP